MMNSSSSTGTTLNEQASTIEKISTENFDSRRPSEFSDHNQHIKPAIRHQHSMAASTHADGSPTQHAKRQWPGWSSERHAYSALLAGFLLMFNSWGMINAYGTFSSYYNARLLTGQDKMRFNFIGSTQCFFVLLLSAPVGRFLDAGYITALLSAGTFLSGIGMFMLSVITDGGRDGHLRDGSGNYGLVWLTQGLITGVGMSFFFVSSSQVVTTWFKSRKFLAIGIVATGASAAGLVYPFMLRILISSHGFNVAVRAVAAVSTGTSILAIFLARSAPTFKPRKLVLTPSSFIDREAFANPCFLCLVLAITFLFLGFYCVFFTLEEWASFIGVGVSEISSAGPDQIATAYLLGIMNASSFVGRVVAGYFSDRFRPQGGALLVHMIVMWVGTLLLFCMWTTVTNLAGVLAFTVIFGMFSGAIIGLPPATVSYILGNHKDVQSKLGQWTGMMYSCSSITALVGPVISGHLISEYGNYYTVQCWSGVCLLLSALCLSAAMYYKPKAHWMREIERARAEVVELAGEPIEDDNKTEKTSSSATSVKDEEMNTKAKLPV